MFIELLDALRCVADHPRIPLVIAITKRDDRFVLEGTMGCPTCGREYPIRHGVAWFTSETARLENEPLFEPDDEAPVRAAAYLGASDGATVALVGTWAAYATAVAQLVPLRAYAVNPSVALQESERVGVLHSGGRLPFGEGTLSGVAIGDPAWSDSDVAMAVSALLSGGRMAAPVTARVPDDIIEIARDAHTWVGEKRGPLVALHRR